VAGATAANDQRGDASDWRALVTPGALEAAAETRWLNWQGRYARSSRRSGIQARAFAVVVFVGIAVMLLMQLLARRA
jgi:hypothetical protein